MAYAGLLAQPRRLGAVERLKARSDDLWLEIGEAVTLKDAHVAQMRAIHE